MRRHALTENQWRKIKNFLPPERKPQGGLPAKGNRSILSAMIFWLNTGIPWRYLPERFGPWQTVYTRYRRWSEQGVWEAAFQHLIAHDIVDESSLVLDRTIIRVHQRGNSSKKEESKRRLARVKADSQ